MHKFFILIHLLYSSTCFEHYYAHHQEEGRINTLSGIVTLETNERSKLLKCIYLQFRPPKITKMYILVI